MMLFGRPPKFHEDQKVRPVVEPRAIKVHFKHKTGEGIVIDYTVEQAKKLYEELKARFEK
jgi:hypothetical protein